MNKTDFMAVIAKNIHDMRQEKQKYKYQYDHYDRSKFYDIARKIHRYNPVEVKDSMKYIDSKNITNNFLSSIETLDNEYIYDFYKNMLNRIKIIRQRVITVDEAILEYDLTNGKLIDLSINLPKNRLNITNQIAFSHEMGHIPELNIIRESFFEYNEVLPFFFEYIASLSCYDLESAKKNFLYDNLSSLLEEAYNMLKIFKNCDSNNNVISMYYTQLYADNYKFFESFDFVLQLIDLYEKDKKTVLEELEKVFKGKSLNDVSNDLEIDPSECKRLLKEYKG